MQRWRESPSGVIAPAEARRPFRLWMTGSLAVVMAAMLPLRAASETERSHALRVLRHSRFGVDETVQRIQLAVRDQGLTVLALLPGTRSVLVLASSFGGTPVVMERADSHPSVPLSVVVREGRAGGADVLLAAASTTAEARAWHDLPASVADDIEALPALVDRALS